MMEKHNIKIEVNAKIPCPKCHKGNLLPFLKGHYVDEGMYNPRPEQFGHYEIVYKCSNCHETLDLIDC